MREEITLVAFRKFPNTCRALRAEGSSLCTSEGVLVGIRLGRKHSNLALTELFVTEQLSLLLISRVTAPLVAGGSHEH